jgi:hypothetical protein
MVKTEKIQPHTEVYASHVPPLNSSPEGLINNHLYYDDDPFITENRLFTPFQFGSQKNTQTHNAQNTLTSVIQNNATHNSCATYCAFIDFSTTYPASHKEQLI